MARMLGKFQGRLVQGRDPSRYPSLEHPVRRKLAPETHSSAASGPTHNKHQRLRGNSCTARPVFAMLHM